MRIAKGRGNGVDQYRLAAATYAAVFVFGALGGMVSLSGRFARNPQLRWRRHVIESVIGSGLIAVVVVGGGWWWWYGENVPDPIVGTLFGAGVGLAGIPAKTFGEYVKGGISDAIKRSGVRITFDRRDGENDSGSGSDG